MRAKRSSRTSAAAKRIRARSQVHRRADASDTEDVRRALEELAEAREQQSAAAEILKIISASPANAQPVFDAIGRHAVNLCDSLFANVFQFDGKLVHWVSSEHYARKAVDILHATYPMRPNISQVSGRVILSRTIVRMEDALSDPNYDRRFPNAGRWRRMLGVPMLREGVPIGAIVVGWAEPGPIAVHHEDLLKTFADQAVIAIENVRSFNEIQDKSAQLEMASRHKSEFLANMSHELRTPLNAILGFSEVLTEKLFGELNEKQLDYLKDIYSSGQHLLSLINEILDLSKIEAGKMELEPSDFDLPTVLQSSLSLVKERAQRHGIALNLEIAAGLGTIRADERKFKQIMLNLLSNAVKFTPDGGRVAVTATIKGKLVAVAVADSGAGIAPEDHGAVFEEFRQLGRDTGRKAEGTGLGLPLAKRFVELHGGHIRLESAIGTGSTFTFTIPMHSG
jgi:signal transduction histidine kinase